VRIASHRELLPEALIDKVDYDDIESAARIAAAIIQEKRRTSPETMAYLHTNYGVEKQRAAYADAILNAQVQPEMPYELRPINPDTIFKLAPWCYRAARGIYHDFRVEYLQSNALNTLLAHFPAGFSANEAVSQGVAQAQVLDWYRQAYLTPLN
jgi:hypothetical protein